MSNDMNNQQLISVADAVIVRQENISTIVQAGPQSYQTNRGICERGLKAGRELLDEATRDGMSDDLDQRIAKYITLAKKSVANMYERRSPVTKLFDQVRSEFTALENHIDPAKTDTVPFRLVQLRNEYAAHKREEAERRRREELAAQEHTRALETYRVDIEEDYRRAYNQLSDRAINELTELAQSLTVDNYQAVSDTITGYASALPADWVPASSVRQPYNITPDEAKAIRDETLRKLMPKFREQYVFDVDEYRRQLLDKLPSKKTELERIAAADARDAGRMKAEMARKEAEEAVRKEQERRKAEEEARSKAELDKANAEMSGLFGIAKAGQSYMPKAKVSQKIEVSDPKAFLAIVSMWWQHEGSTLSVEDLGKIFKKQVAFCEKLANKQGILVESVGLEYVEEVKAQ